MQESLDFKSTIKKIHEPYPHQEEAVEAILNTFKKHSRTHVVMACGTGKTHVCLWVSEKIKAKRIAVFVPSLALIAQIFDEWMDNKSWNAVSCIAICSDPTVTKRDEETFILKPEECNFPVTTNPKEARIFLRKKFTGVQLIFCTYQSSPTLAIAMQKTGIEFDLLVCDEAHKTTGAYDRIFSIPLSDDNIPAKKRLFVTATPKHYDIKKNKDTENKLLYSMDNKSSYGPRAYTLSFRQAVNLGIICDYRVLIPIIVNENESIISGKGMDEKAIAIEKAIESYNISKIITFHHSIHDAGSFIYYLNNTNQMKHFNKHHVNCTIPVSKRNETMGYFKREKKGIISNARCLSEGANIPAADMVVFFHHKRSKIDIVQAIGRVMRKHKSKTIGYVFLPLYIKKMKEESIEEAINREHYEQVWDVLQALSEQDEDLHQTIQFLRFERGNNGEENLEKLSRFIEFLPNDNIDVNYQNYLRKSISIAIVDNIGSRWYEMYGKLCAFKSENNHCNVPQNYSKDKSLGAWTSTQRYAYKKKNLDQNKIELLSQLGFVWKPREILWYNLYQKLIEFKKQMGHCNVSSRYDQDKSLALWISTQRKNYKNKKLEQNKIELLLQIGFEWKPLETNWHKMYQKLIDFKKLHGHCIVPQRYDNLFGRWVGIQRKAYRNKKLNQNKIQLLSQIEFEWAPIEARWLTMYHRFTNEKNNTSRYSKSLKLWIRQQRKLYKNNKLAQNKIDLLLQKDFEWEPIKSRWYHMYQKLIDFKKEMGHCNVSRGYKNESLRLWVGTQRKLYKKRKLEPNKIELLLQIGFEWEPKESRWYDMYQKLTNFKNKHGHCNVSQDQHKYEALHLWIHGRRRDYKNNKLEQNKIDLLSQLGFEWGPLETKWHKMYQKLIDFKKLHGHCNVLQDDGKNKALGIWVNKLRQDCKNNKLEQNKIDLLFQLGFEWEPLEAKWYKMYQKLIDFKKQYGHCNVSQNYEKNKPLVRWINQQRERYKKKKMKTDRIELLEKIGFCWRRRKS